MHLQDFNVEPNDATMKNFCQIYGCKNIVKDNNLFQKSHKPNLHWLDDYK